MDYFGDLLHIKLRRKLRFRQQIEDVRQEVFLRVLTQIRRKGGLNKPESLGAFVHTVCNNVVLELINKNKRHPPARPPAEQSGGSPLPRPESVDPELNPESRLISKERTKQVRAIIESLPPRDRKILIRIFPEERDRTDVCREFGITPENLRVLLLSCATTVSEGIRESLPPVRMGPSSGSKKRGGGRSFMSLKTEESPYRAERYYLGAMTPAEQEEFEREMFESPELGEEVRDLYIFAENAKSVLQEEKGFQPAPVAVPWFRSPFIWPVAACVALTALVYQSFVSVPKLRQELAELRRPQVVVATVLRPVTRGNDNVVVIREAQELVRLSFDVNPSRPYAGVICSVGKTGAEPAFELPIAPQDLPLGSLEVQFLAGFLEAGRYELVLSGTTGKGENEVIETYEFVVHQSTNGDRGENQ